MRPRRHAIPIGPDSLARVNRDWRVIERPAKAIRAVVADGRRAPVLVSRMSPVDQARFEANLAAFLAADAYVRAVTQNVTYGVPIRPDVVHAWEAARDEFEFERQKRSERGPW